MSPKSQMIDRSFWRFFIANVAGVVFDLGLAYLISYTTGLPLVVCASISLFGAAFVMYFVHEFWTFDSAANRVSSARLAGTVLAAVVALAVRALVLFVLSETFGQDALGRILPLALATGMSFIVSYILNRRIVGRSTGWHKSSP